MSSGARVVRHDSVEGAGDAAEKVSAAMRGARSRASDTTIRVRAWSDLTPTAADCDFFIKVERIPGA